MDASRPRLVHGGGERHRDLETVAHRSGLVRPDLRGVQGARFRCLPGARSRARGLSSGHTPRQQSIAAGETSAKIADGTNSRTHPRFLTLFKPPAIRYSDETDRNNSGPSFPSGHVTDNVIIGTMCVLFFRRWGWLYFIVAATVSYSRIYLGAHWPSDVLGTAFMAVGAAFLVVALAEFVWKRWGPRWAPEWFARHPRLIE